MRALITGVTGQDGSYLAELLLEKGYEVYGVVRSVARAHAWVASLSQPGSITLRPILLTRVHLIGPWNRLSPMKFTILPDKRSSRFPGSAALDNGSYRHGRAADAGNNSPPCSSSQVPAGFQLRDFRKSDEQQQSEATRLRPRNPYGAAKMFAHHITINYRESYGMFACSCSPLTMSRPAERLSL